VGWAIGPDDRTAHSVEVSMTKGLGRHLGLVAFLLLCSAGSLLAGWNMRNWGDALSPVDPYSEANALT
jgi:hypothetical protein